VIFACCVLWRGVGVDCGGRVICSEAPGGAAHVSEHCRQSARYQGISCVYIGFSRGRGGGSGRPERNKRAIFLSFWDRSKRRLLSNQVIASSFRCMEPGPHLELAVSIHFAGHICCKQPFIHPSGGRRLSLQHTFNRNF